MEFDYVLYLLIYLVFIFTGIHSQICVTRKYVTRLVPETFLTFDPHNGDEFGLITLTRYVEKYDVTEHRSCCYGYRKEDSEDASYTTCKPICNSNCTNGYCKDPGECACNAGYTLRDDTCVPHCEGCSHGACVAPDTCQCDSGYSVVHGTCQPVCTPPCVHGICVSPDTCQCLPGYRKSTKIQCYCCNSMICQSSLTCKCDPHLRLQQVERESYECVPKCEPSCGNGTTAIDDHFESLTTSESKLLTNVNYPMAINATTMVSTDITLNNKIKDESTTTTVSYFVSSITVTEKAQDLDAKLNNTKTEIINDKSWMQRNGIFVWIPVVLLLVGIILLLVWRRIPMRIMDRFRGRSYYVYRYHIADM